MRNIAGQNIVIAFGEYNVSMTKVISLNETSLYLWNGLLGRDFSENDVTELLLAEYDVSRGQASADSAEWVKKLSEAGLLE